MRIVIETIPHETHRYPTVGDWFYDEDGTLRIKVSQLSDWRREMLVAIHELVEVLSCKHDGVTQAEVDKFDMEYEKARHPDNVDEPGDDVAAPYKFQHCLATGIERILAQDWGVTWSEYEKELEALP
jgi:hypothetical protein